MYNQSDWEKAHILGHRAFYERSTQTIRACPENYCLAHRDIDSPAKQPAWIRYGEDNATRGWWSAIDKVLDTYGRWSTGDAIASAIGKAISKLPHVRIGIGSRVSCGKKFAAAFEGQRGTITDTKQSDIDGTLYVVTFDTPTAPATNWEPCKTLAATVDCYEVLTDTEHALRL